MCDTANNNNNLNQEKVTIIEDNTCNNKSELLTSNVSCHVFVENVLSFLDRKTIYNVLEVTELLHHFQLKDYYCLDHGTKLIVDTEELAALTDHDDELAALTSHHHGSNNNDDDDDDEGNKNNNKNDEDKTSTSHTSAEVPNANDDCTCNSNENDNNEEDNHSSMNPACIDCIQNEFGNVRCPTCEDFSPEDDIFECIRCNLQSCEDCGNYFNFCCECNEWICEKCEPNFQICDHCCEGYCTNCEGREIVTCKVCHEGGACIECAENVYFCGVCKDSFCYDCKDHFYCQLCGEVFCGTCKEGHPTSGGEVLCDDCYGEDGPIRCEECGKSTPADRVFCCGECETSTCRRCTKAYACSECDKAICADCQSFFKICCCKKKGKFTLTRKE